MDINKVISSGRCDPVTAFEIFDHLDAVESEFMMGTWMGSGFHTSHPMDGLLEAYHWYGKQFLSPEKVQPLICRTLGGRKSNINPIFMLPLLNLMGRGALPTSKIIATMLSPLMPLLSTSKSKARLRMMNYRGKSSATMIYDHLPINDIFRKIDENKVLGVMDLKKLERPFFFILQRE